MRKKNLAMHLAPMRFPLLLSLVHACRPGDEVVVVQPATFAGNSVHPPLPPVHLILRAATVAQPPRSRISLMRRQARTSAGHKRHSLTGWHWAPRRPGRRQRANTRIVRKSPTRACGGPGGRQQYRQIAAEGTSSVSPRPAGGGTRRIRKAAAAAAARPHARARAQAADRWQRELHAKAQYR